MKESDIIQLTQQLLDSIVNGDVETYQNLCAEDITCFEPETCGHQVVGIEFHNFFFDASADASGGEDTSNNMARVTMIDTKVRMLGAGENTAAVISYVRINQTYDPKNGVKITKSCETRVWQEVTDDNEGSTQWKNVHMHRSAA